jgi:two-component system, LytTR family, response regulator
LEGYELDVMDYLLKPVQFERILKAISKVFQLTSISQQPLAPFPEKKDARQDSYLYCRTDRKMVKVFLEVIIYIEGMKNYIKVITSAGTVITKNSMAAVETVLSNEEFIRVHRSYFVPKGKNKVICRRDDRFRRCGETHSQTIQK